MHDPKCANCGFINPVGMRFCGNCGTALPKKTPTIPRAIIETASLQSWMGRDIKEVMRQAGIDAAGERRNVTVLFADLSNYTAVTQELEDERVFHLIKQYLRVLAEDVYRYEGVVDKYTGDGLMALFGAPIAYENNAERAVRAALDMQAGVEMMRSTIQDEFGVDLQMRIGLNSGLVIVGGVGIEQMMDYTAVGDTVNLASRLESAAAPGTILVSESVYRQTKALFTFKEVPEIHLKGYQEPVKAYQVTGVKRTPGQVRGLEGLSTPMIGRDKELSRLRQVVDTLQTDRNGHLVLVIGEAGIGKSRLTTEWRAYIDPQQVNILEGKSLTYRKSISYWIFVDLLRQYLNVSEEAPETEVATKLRQKVEAVLSPAAASQALPYLARLLSINLSEDGIASQIDELGAEQLRRQIFLSVRELLSAEARKKPLLLILEDLHWADDASIELINFLLDSLQATPLVIYGITRPFQNGPLSKLLKAAREHLPNRVLVIQLHNLSAEESNQLLDQLLAISDFPQTLLDQIIQKSSGVPFYLEEILRMLIEENYIERVGDHWQLTPGVDVHNLGVPNTLNDLILTRFDRLDFVARRVLQVTSVIGREFTVPILQLALADQLQEQQIQAALDELVEREFITPKSNPASQSGAGPAAYAFRHVLTSDAVYGTMLRQDRNAFHLRVAQAIEQLHADRLDGYVELLASHYLRSPQLDRALHYLILAGQKAARNHANEEARQHFINALGLLSKITYLPTQAYQIHIGMGDILTLMGEYHAARSHYQSAAEALELDDPGKYVRERSELDRKMAITFERQGDFDKALTRLSVSMRLLRSLPEATPFDQAKIVNDIGWIYFRRGDIDEAEMYLNLALSQVEGSAHYHLLASIYNRLGGVYFRKEQLDLASEYVRKSLALREEIGDIVEMARTYNNLGLLDWRRGLWDSALQNFRHSMQLNAKLGDVESMIHLQSNISLLLIDRGEMVEAEKNLLESLRRAEAIGHTLLRGAAYLNLSRYWLAKRDWVNALSAARESLEVFSGIGTHENLPTTWWCIGEAHLGLGELEKAQEACQLALNLLESRRTKALVPTQERGQLFRLLGKIHLQKGDLDLARQYFDQSIGQFTLLDDQLELARSLLEKARLLDQTEATRLHMEAKAIFVRLGAKLDLVELNA